MEDSAGHPGLPLGQDWEFACNLPYGTAVGMREREGEELLCGFALIK